MLHVIYGDQHLHIGKTTPQRQHCLIFLMTHMSKARVRCSSHSSYHHGRAFRATDTTWKQFRRDWYRQGMDSVLSCRPYAVLPRRIWNLCRHQLLMRRVTRVCIGPAALCRLHLPSSQHHSAVRRLSISTPITHNCISHCQNLTYARLLTNYRTACQLFICGSVRTSCHWPREVGAVLLSTSQLARYQHHHWLV